MSAKILIIDDDLDTLKLVGVMLERQGYEIHAASDGRQGLAKANAERPDLILLDLMMPGMDGYEVAREIRRNPSIQATPILMFTARGQLDEKVTGFEAGADDYLTKPTHPTELQAHVRALVARSTRPLSSEQAAPKPVEKAPTVAVLAPRGGLGVSTVACNLAGAFHVHTKADVILAELTPGMGTLWVELGLPKPSNLKRLLSAKAADITRDRVESSLVSHGSGLKLLLASDDPRDVSLTAHVEQMVALVTCLASLGSPVVLDLGSGMPPHVEAILPLCGQRVVVTEASPHTLAQARTMLDEIAGLGIDPSSISVVLNRRVRGDSQILGSEVQKMLGHPLACILPAAPELLLAAAKAHVPAVIAEPSNTTSQQILQLAGQLEQRSRKQ